MLLKLVQTGKIGPSSLITHGEPHMSTSPPPGVLVKVPRDRHLMTGVDFAFSDIEKAYSTFKAAANHKALKVLINM
jgi:threonine dehydrogenase-like Zn-dependent dehydrogenase